MKKYLPLVLSLFVSTSALAQIQLEPLLNRVTLQLQAEQWVTTKSALVSVSINAAVAGQGVDKIQSDVLQKLNQLSNKGEWHIVSFDRQQDKTGLESMQILAQARLPQSDLGGLRDQAKAISKPGIAFTIDNVQFLPSDDEIKQAQNVLRANLYNQAKMEIDTLNKIYPDQKYYLHQIDFISPVMNGGMQAEAYAGKSRMMSAVAIAAPVAPPLSVGNKTELQAVVVLAAMPEQIIQALGSKP